MRGGGRAGVFGAAACYGFRDKGNVEGQAMKCAECGTNKVYSKGMCAPCYHKSYRDRTMNEMEELHGIPIGWINSISVACDQFFRKRGMK